MASPFCDYCGRPDNAPGATHCASCGHELPTSGVPFAPEPPPPMPEVDTSVEDETEERREAMREAESQRRITIISIAVAGVFMLAITATLFVEHEHKSDKKKTRESDHHSDVGQSAVITTPATATVAPRDPNVVELGYVSIPSAIPSPLQS